MLSSASAARRLSKPHSRSRGNRRQEVFLSKSSSSSVSDDDDDDDDEHDVSGQLTLAHETVHAQMSRPKSHLNNKHRSTTNTRHVGGPMIEELLQSNLELK
jgi:hypothetical protein